jgi:carbon starvation protein
MRNRGQTVGEIAGRLITPRARLLFLIILFFSLTIVLAIFGLVIASIFKLYPAAVFSVWIEIPIAVAIGFWVYKRKSTLLLPSLLALGLLYLAVYIGAYHFPIELPGSWGSPIVIWTLVLMVYCFIASVLPVWTLMQPRDYINSHQLVVALGLLVMGLFLAGISGDANLDSAPAVADIQKVRESGAPPILPFLFITIACGAISGFHCLVSSGTSSKQIESETDAQYVGYGAMLLEGALAVIVILACCAGLGMGAFAKAPNEGTLLVHSKTGDHYHIKTGAVSAEGEPTGETLKGRLAWKTSYDVEKGWGKFKNSLSKKIGAFIEGGANFLHALRIPFKMGITIMAVLVASFAATTLDTATRLQRYVIQELGSTLHIAPLRNKYLATGLAVVFGGAMAMIPGPKGPGTGGLILWPLFGATNQLLAGLAFMVIVFYLWRRNKPIWFAFIPMLIMLIMPAWAMVWQLFNSQSGWLMAGEEKNYLLGSIGLGTLCLQVWMVVEGLMIWKAARGVLEEPLPPLENQPGSKLA